MFFKLILAHVNPVDDALAECELEDDHLSRSRSPKVRLFEDQITTSSMKTYIAGKICIKYF